MNEENGACCEILECCDRTGPRSRLFFIELVDRVPVRTGGMLGKFPRSRQKLCRWRIAIRKSCKIPRGFSEISGTPVRQPFRICGRDFRLFGAFQPRLGKRFEDANPTGTSLPSNVVKFAPCEGRLGEREGRLRSHDRSAEELVGAFEARGEVYGVTDHGVIKATA